MIFKHCIVTRFNAHIDTRCYDFRLSDTWLAERFELFNTFCLPSVVGQQCQDFVWLVLFDAETPEKFRRIIAFLQKYKKFIPLYCKEFPTILPQVKERIVTMFPEADYYLTTRLDNDDALSRKFVAIIHDVVEKVLSSGKQVPPELFINFPNGLQYCNGSCYDFYDPTNAFVSLLERNKPPHTVFWVEHPSIYDKAPVAQIETKPIFLQNIHDMNLYNYIRGDVMEDKDILADFDLQL
ncbi:conserved hypothetical protein [Solidesulfovibrio fructosivorans JJ]]|uniref:Rhamnosyl transferase n=1 Tax=Solidesulfovibrio fructosivorans JJ] TaxID=596151 RepID=E1JSK7_SOLFR|nr:glycosyltransferase [Solidesulfovibrio fructosivorans]EFL52490.1 conserved hypothetical protein [Solidesulfovibrio fructosivorans JJ]]